MKTHTDGIWISAEREKQTIKELTEHILSCGYSVVTQNTDNYGYAYEFVKGDTKLNCRLVDTVNYTDITVTDNHRTVPIDGVVHSILPEFWSQWRFDPQYIDRPSTYGYNCFMGRRRPERDRVFDILKRQKILEYGLVSYFENNIHDTVNSHGTLEQCIIDSNISLVLETYTLDTNIVFSEKIFRALQLPRPWLLYCSPLSIQLLKKHGFDVLADYVDHEYDTITNHWQRMDMIIEQLKTFIDKQFTRRDYERFEQAAKHNQELLSLYLTRWPLKLAEIKHKIRLT